MSRFVGDSYHGLFNARHIAQAYRLKRSTRLVMEHGEVYTVGARVFDQLADGFLPTVVPACPGFQAVLFYPPDGANPDDFDIRRNLSFSPVIAWGVPGEDTSEDPVPILPDGALSEHLWSSWFYGVLWPDGQVNVPYDCTCPSLDDWINVVRTQWRNRQDMPDQRTSTDSARP